MWWSISDTRASCDELHLSAKGDSMDIPAWTEIEPGRYMPRRVRGSAHGRALG